MLSLEKATRPAAQNTNTPSTMIALRVRPKLRIDLINCPSLRDVIAVRRSAFGSGQELVAQEHRSVSHNGFVRAHAFKNLVPTVLLQADLDRPLGETTAVARDPDRHGAV